MKKILITILFALAVVGSPFAAGVKKVYAGTSGSLKNEFSQDFDINNQENLNEQKAGDNQKKTENQLPVQAKRTFAKMFEGYNIKQAVRLAGAEGDAYYISAENEKESIIVKIDDNLEVLILKKLKEQYRYYKRSQSLCLQGLVINHKNIIHLSFFQIL